MDKLIEKLQKLTLNSDNDKDIVDDQEIDSLISDINSLALDPETKQQLVKIIEIMVAKVRCIDKFKINFPKFIK